MTAVLEVPKKKTIKAYGVEFVSNPQLVTLLNNDLHRELLFFRQGVKMKGYNGPGSYFHEKNVITILSKQRGIELKWNDWLETCLEEYATVDEVLVTGPASASKTYGAAWHAVNFWLCDPENTAVIVCSTTLPGLKRRIWGEIRKIFGAIRPVIGQGNLVDSKTAIQTTKGDMQHGIFGIAVAEGNEQKALGRIIGFHPKRILVVVDELTDVSWAIVDALNNLFTAKDKAQFIGIGNAASIFDSHGKMCEPKEGWGSINVESERWDTQRGGVCVHLDGFKSPNVKAGETLFKFLITQEYIDKRAERDGMDSPGMWRFVRGFWCPEGTTKTILSESLISKFLAMTKVTWEGVTELWAGLDPAFEGGDRCILRFAKTGKDMEGKKVLELGEIITIKLDLKSNVPIHYQIARQVKEACIQRGVDIYHFGMDTTGEGGALASIISQEWEPGFHQVEFGGKPSDFPVSEINNKPCYEEYQNKVCELWYSFRQYLMNSQIRGLDAETAVEFCSRLYEVKAKINLEPKSEMKKRLNGRSPDMADAVTVILDIVKHRGGLGAIVSKAKRSINRAWDKIVETFQIGDSDFSADPMDNL